VASRHFVLLGNSFLAIQMNQRGDEAGGARKAIPSMCNFVSLCQSALQEYPCLQLLIAFPEFFDEITHLFGQPERKYQWIQTCETQNLSKHGEEHKPRTCSQSSD